jgi:hypothetical protein
MGSNQPDFETLGLKALLDGLGCVLVRPAPEEKETVRKEPGKKERFHAANHVHTHTHTRFKPVVGDHDPAGRFLQLLGRDGGNRRRRHLASSGRLVREQ